MKLYARFKDMEQSWLDLMPKDITDEISHQLTKNSRKELHVELQAELLQDVPGEGVWVDKPTLYHALALQVHDQMTSGRCNASIIKHWVAGLELDVFERIALNSVLDVWRDQSQLAYIVSRDKKLYPLDYYVMNFISMLPYQSLLCLKQWLNDLP